MALPTKLNTEVGYALWWLTHDEHGVLSDTEIIQRLIARGHVDSPGQARAVLRQAQADRTASAVIQRATGRGTLKAACNYKCPDDTPIALRLLVSARNAQGQIVDNRSIVVNATAGENLRDVLDRARNIFNRRYRRGTTKGSGELYIENPLQPSDVMQVLLNYTEGRMS